MKKFYKRNICVAIIMLFIIFVIVYKYHYGASSDNLIVSSDDFIAVAYLIDENVEKDGKEYNINNRILDNQLLNITDFRYTLQPTNDVCSDDLLAILLVTSYVGHDEVRSAHRMAISSSDLRQFKILRVFLLAEIPSKEKYITQSSIESEHKHFNDIVQGNFVEAYRNLSYKHVMGLRWASFHTCLQPKFIVKMDDDIVVDFYHLIEYLSLNKEHFQNENENKHFLAGYIFRNVVPIRLHQNKWFVTGDEFKGNIYPNYLSGWMYVTTKYTAKSLVKAAFDQKIKIFWIDDIWITGILRERQRIPIDESLNDLFSANSQFIDCCITNLKKFKYKCPFIAGPNGADHALIKNFMHIIHKQCYNGQNNFSYNHCTNHDSIKKTCVGTDKHLLKKDHGAAIINEIRL